jgi:hypothetical protein
MWKNVEDQCKELYDNHAIKANDTFQRKNLIRLIADEFPSYTRLRIAYAVDEYLKTTPKLLQANAFVSFVKSYIQL